MKRGILTNITPTFFIQISCKTPCKDLSVQCVQLDIRREERIAGRISGILQHNLCYLKTICEEASAVIGRINMFLVSREKMFSTSPVVWKWLKAKQ